MNLIAFFNFIAIQLLIAPICLSQENPKTTSVIQILAQPESFSGKKVTVEGFVSIRSENAAVYTFDEARRYGMASYGIWLNTKTISPAQAKKFDGKCCRLSGFYSSERTNNFVGTLKVENIWILEEDYVIWRDSLLKELGHVEHRLESKHPALNKDEEMELQVRHRDLQSQIEEIDDRYRSRK